MPGPSQQSEAAALAEKFGVHRRMVRQVLLSAAPPPRKKPTLRATVLDPAEPWIDDMLWGDASVPRKQHTARRVYRRLAQEYGFDLDSYSTGDGSAPPAAAREGRQHAVRLGQHVLGRAVTKLAPQFVGVVVPKPVEAGPHTWLVVPLVHLLDHEADGAGLFRPGGDRARRCRSLVTDQGSWASRATERAVDAGTLSRL